MRQGKDYNKPSFKKQNKVVAFVKDKRFLKIQICLLHCETSIGIYQNMITRQSPRKNYDNKIEKHTTNVIPNGDSNPQNHF